MGRAGSPEIPAAHGRVSGGGSLPGSHTAPMTRRSSPGTEHLVGVGKVHVTAADAAVSVVAHHAATAGVVHAQVLRLLQNE